MTKSELKTHIQSKWKYYILSIFVAFVVSLIAITVSSSPTKKEKVAIFLTCYNASNNLSGYMESIKPDYLEIIELNIKHKEDMYYGTVLKGFSDSADMIIVPESKIDYIAFKNTLVLTDDMMSEFTSKHYDYYSVDGVNYGIKVYSKDTKEGILSGYITFEQEDSDEDYYLFISNKSLHMGKYNNSQYDGAIIVLKEILNYEA